MQSTSRRDFLKVAGGAALGAVAVSSLGTVLSCSSPASVGLTTSSTSVLPSLSPTPSPSSTASPSVVPVKFPWPYKKLDPVAAAERAYAAYYNGGCMYGGFEGIVGELRQQVGPPYDGFPAAMMKYGAAGVSGWGTLCGALNGAAAAVFLLYESAAGNPIINDVFGWYGTASLPDYKPAKPKIASIESSVADSQLCHISVSRWATRTGFKTTSPERADRCAWLTASVVKHTVDLLNKQSDGAFKQTFANPVSVTGCLSCHGKGGLVENVHITNQTQCTECHTTLPVAHPGAAK